MRIIVRLVFLFALLVTGGCTSGGSPPGCTEGESKCDGTVVMACADGKFLPVEDCADQREACEVDTTGAAGCVEDVTPCTEGETRCQGAVIEICAGGAFQLDRDCPQDGKTCLLNPISGLPECTGTDCVEGDSRCLDTEVQVCDGGVFVTESDCSDRFMICELDDASGEAGCVTPPACSEGDERCAGDVIESCTNGEYTSGTNCALMGRVCVDDPAAKTAECVVAGCQEGATRCQENILEICTAGDFQPDRDCAAIGRICEVDPGSGRAACVGLAWMHRPIVIVDPIVNGTSLMLPTDNPSFGYDPGNDLYLTQYGRDYFDPAIAYAWMLDGLNGDHFKTELSGDVFSQGENFCVGGENWCQLIGFDPVSGTWLITGPSTTAMMHVDATGLASLTATSGTRPPDSWINRSHRFAWSGRSLFLYGATGPSGFGDTVHALDLDAGTWTAAVTGLAQVDDNCLAWNSQAGELVSFGGRETTDGGDTTRTLSTYTVIDVGAATAQTHDLPAGIGARRAVNCAFDPGRGVFFVYGGSVLHDHWNEILNEYHNDLWMLDPANGEWTLLMEETVGGTFTEPDQYGDRRFEGDPSGPNFGKNRGHMLVDTANDRLMIIGSVPIFTHEQLYFLYLEGL